MCECIEDLVAVVEDTNLMELVLLIRLWSVEIESIQIDTLKDAKQTET